MQMPGRQQQMQMPQPPVANQGAMQQPQAPQPAEAMAEPEEPDPFASFGDLTGIKSSKPKPQAVPPTAEAPVDVPAPQNPAPPAPEPVLTTAATPTAAPEPAPTPPAPIQPLAPAKAVNLGSMGFPMPASQPPPTATDTHQALMFEDIKAHASGDSFSFAPVDTPQPSVSEPSVPVQQQAPPVTAQPTAAAGQYSSDNPFAFI
tara:strand:+ start:34 stop:642 length:609 start_codon:yes stop_codon:yes gene_type:complete